MGSAHPIVIYFFVAQGGLVGKEFDNKERIKSEDQYRTMSTVTILELFERFETPPMIDYMSLDVEGAEEFVMKQFPFDKYRISILTIERPSQGLKNILERQGYKLVKELTDHFGETLWIHQDVESSLDRSALDIDTQNYKYREKSAGSMKR